MNLLISENAYYAKGGAEMSLFAYCKNTLRKNSDIEIVCCKSDTGEIDYKSAFSNVNLRLFKRIKTGFHYFDALLFFIVNFYKLREIIHESKQIITQNRWAGYVVFISNNFQRRQSKPIIFIRDEKCLGINKCYQNGWRKLFWWLRYFIEYPFFYLHNRIRSYAFRRSHVIFNSKFMYKLALKENFHIESYEILYPEINQINKQLLSLQLKNLGDPYTRLQMNKTKNAVMVGCERVKGIDTFKRLASKNPQMNFIIFCRSTRTPTFHENLIYLPWSGVAGLPYALADICIVPSLWNEAYGRVVVEAQQFGCVVVISNKGGLKEALGDYKNGFIANNESDYQDILNKYSKDQFTI